jgi:hypothetical protein
VRTDGCAMSKATVCARCGRAPSEPIRGLEAARHRNHFALALGPTSDVQAYAFCIATVLCLEHQGQECRCDRDAWTRAVKHYEKKGAVKCWLALGVTEDLMKRADIVRLQELQHERALRPDEIVRLGELERWAGAQ